MPFGSPARRAVLRGQRQRDSSLWTPFLRCGGNWNGNHRCCTLPRPPNGWRAGWVNTANLFIHEYKLEKTDTFLLYAAAARRVRRPFGGLASTAKREAARQSPRPARGRGKMRQHLGVWGVSPSGVQRQRLWRSLRRRGVPEAAPLALAA